MRYPITPVGKPRQTQADKWKKRPAVMRYRAFADEVRVRGIDVPAAGARVIFEIPMPESWSKKRKADMNGRPHQAKPDVDNLLKALLDAVHGDDKHVHSLSGVGKVWSYEGGIQVEIEESDDVKAAG